MADRNLYCAVTVAVALSFFASTAHAERPRVRVKVSFADQRFGARLFDHARRHGPVSDAESYLAGRIGARLGQLLPMFIFVTNAAEPAAETLHLEIGTAEARYPSFALQMRVVFGPGSSPIGDFELLPRCVRAPGGPPCMPDDFHKSQWLENRLKEIVSNWGKFGAVFRDFEFSGHKVTNLSGLARVSQLTAAQLGRSNSHESALYETISPSGHHELFWVCSNSSSTLAAIWPFVTKFPVEDVATKQCRNHDQTTTESDWLSFRLVRYWR